MSTWTRPRIEDRRVQLVAMASKTSALPASHVYNELVGPFYDITGLTRWWGVNRQTVNEAVATGAVIACQLDGGQWVYPVWQFIDSGAAHPHLITLWATLRAAADPWTCAVWLCTPQSELDDQSAVRWIAHGHFFEAVLALARADAQHWAGDQLDDQTVSHPPPPETE